MLFGGIVNLQDRRYSASPFHLPLLTQSIDFLGRQNAQVFCPQEARINPSLAEDGALVLGIFLVLVVDLVEDFRSPTADCVEHSSEESIQA